MINFESLVFIIQQNKHKQIKKIQNNFKIKEIVALFYMASFIEKAQILIREESFLQQADIIVYLIDCLNF